MFGVDGPTTKSPTPVVLSATGRVGKSVVCFFAFRFTLFERGFQVNLLKGKMRLAFVCTGKQAK